jgi:hypothetical protein
MRGTKRIYAKMQAFREQAGLPWFTKPWDLNLIIARSGSVGRWDDVVMLACLDDAGRRVVHTCVATGDAWSGEWKNPTHSDGCIYVLDGHYPGGLELGEHKGRPAMRQRKAFRCVRWPTSEGRIPTVAELVALADGGAAFTEIRGTHWHNRVSNYAPEAPKTDDSEGCTVSLHWHEHIAGIEMVKTQRDRLGSAIVSPTYCQRGAMGL